MIQIKCKRIVAVSVLALTICSLIWLNPIPVEAAPLNSPMNASANQGTLPVPPVLSIQKEVIPANDPGRFDLVISNNVIVSNIGDGGSTGNIPVNPGNHIVAEVAAPGTSLTDYNTTISCVDQANQPVGSISNGSSLGIIVALNQKISCTILNVRKNALELTKTDNGVSAQPGELITYELTYANIGAVSLDGVQIRETVPAYASFEPAASSPGWLCQADGNAGSSCAFELGTVAPNTANSTPILFAVIVDSTLPSNNITTINNVARITDSAGLNVATDSETTPIDTRPILSAQKDESLLNDADGNGIASPGDTISYRIKVENRGDAPATSIILTDSPDPYTTLKNGSINTSLGAVLQGNNVGDSDVRVDIGTLIPGASATIFYGVLVNTSLPITVTHLQNQAIVTSNELPAIATDDPDTLTANDPTIVSLSVMPNLLASQMDSLAVDRDGDGFPSPGDTILMEVVISNIGNGNAANVLFKEALDPNTQIVAGSLTTTQGTITSGSGANDIQLELFLGTLPPSTIATIQYEILVKDPLPTSVAELRLQGVISGDGFPNVLTDDLALPTTQDPTSISISSVAAMSITKRDLLFVDSDNDNFASANDILFYRIEIVNNGNAASENLLIDDMPPPHTTLLPGSVQTNQGRVLMGNTDGDSSVQIDLGSVAGGGQNVIITYQVRIDTFLPIDQIASQAMLKTFSATSSAIIAISDDPDTTALNDITVTKVRVESASLSLYLSLFHNQVANNHK